MSQILNFLYLEGPVPHYEPKFCFLPDLLSLSHCLLLLQHTWFLSHSASCWWWYTPPVPVPLPTTIPGSCLTALPAGGGTLLLSLSLAYYYTWFLSHSAACWWSYTPPVPVPTTTIPGSCLTALPAGGRALLSWSCLTLLPRERERERDTIPVF